MLKIKSKLNRYRKDNGKIMQVYTITGEKESLKEYKETQGDNYKEQDGEVLYFSSKVLEIGDELIITTYGNIVPNDIAKISHNDEIEYHQKNDARVSYLMKNLGWSKKEAIMSIFMVDNQE